MLGFLVVLADRQRSLVERLSLSGVALCQTEIRKVAEPACRFGGIRPPFFFGNFQRASAKGLGLSIFSHVAVEYSEVIESSAYQRMFCPKELFPKCQCHFVKRFR